jgi:hypothetical protein
MKTTIPFTRPRLGRSRFSRLLSWLAGLATLTTSAWAEAKVVGVYVEGPQASEVREALAGDAPDGVTVAEVQAFADALAEKGQKVPFGKALDGEGPKHQASIQRVHEAASSMGLAAVLVGRVTKEKGKWKVRLWLVEGASGNEQGPEDVILDAPGDAQSDSDLKSTVEEMLERYGKDTPAASAEPSPPAGEPTGGTVSADEDHGPSSNRPHGVMARSMLEVEVGADAAGRNFNYNDGITSNLRSYNVLPAALATGSVELFPLADQKSFLRDIGVIGSYARSLFLGSSVGSGVSIRTVESSISAGLRMRLHPWGDAGPIIGVSDAYTSQAVTFDPAGGGIDNEIPAVNYQANRTGVDARIPFGSFALLGGAGFRAVLDAGEVAQRFRLSSVEGIDAELGVAYTVIPGWEARLLGDYERYFYAFKPVPGDAYVAGGALDQFFGGTLALAYIY